MILSDYFHIMKYNDKRLTMESPSEQRLVRPFSRFACDLKELAKLESSPQIPSGATVCTFCQ